MKSGLFAVLKNFFPIFLLVATLPFLLGLVLSPSKLKFLTRADQQDVLRIWFEPSTIVTGFNQEAELILVARFESESSLIPAITVKLDPAGPIVLDRETVSYKIPFKGKVVLGSVIVRPLKGGTLEIKIPSSEVIIEAQKDPIEIITSSAKVVVR